MEQRAGDVAPVSEPSPVLSPQESQVDRLLTLTIGVSLAAHALLVGLPLVFHWHGLFGSLPTLRLIYDQDAVRETSQWAKQELERVHSRLAALHQLAPIPAPGAVADGHRLEGVLQEAIGFGISNVALRATIGDGSADQLSSKVFGGSGAWATAVDLTNLEEASHGNPVLLSYFGAIREQIQRMANARAWVPSAEASGGTVYVGFTLGRTGAMQSMSVVPERSSASAPLHDVALRIIKAAAPFPPFPPSFQESSKAIIVPLEFSVGPQ